MASNIFVVFENLTGHRRSFVDSILFNCREENIEITILTLGETDNYIKSDRFMECEVQIFPNRRSLLSNILRISEQNAESRFYFMDFDKWLNYFLPIRNVNFYGLILRPYLSGKKPSEVSRFALKQILIILLRCRFPRRIFKLSIPMQRHHFGSGWVDELPVKFNDFPISKPVILHNLDKREQRFLIIGAISERKRLDLAIDLVSSFSKKTNLPAVLSVVGKLENDSLGSVEVKNIRIRIVDRYLSDREYQDEIYATDFLIALNSNIGSSRTILEGIHSKKIVISGRLSRHWKNFKKIYSNQLYERVDFLEKANAEKCDAVNQDVTQTATHISSRMNWYDAMFNQAK